MAALTNLLSGNSEVRQGIGHTALNDSLYKIGKYESGKCDKCRGLETVMHIIIECSAYERERFQLIQELGWLGVDKYC